MLDKLNMDEIHLQHTPALLVLWHGFQHQLNLERVAKYQRLVLLALLQDFAQHMLVLPTLGNHDTRHLQLDLVLVLFIQHQSQQHVLLKILVLNKKNKRLQ